MGLTFSGVVWCDAGGDVGPGDETSQTLTTSRHAAAPQRPEDEYKTHDMIDTSAEAPSRVYFAIALSLFSGNNRSAVEDGRGQQRPGHLLDSHDETKTESLARLVDLRALWLSAAHERRAPLSRARQLWSLGNRCCKQCRTPQSRHMTPYSSVALFLHFFTGQRFRFFLIFTGTQAGELWCRVTSSSRLSPWAAAKMVSQNGH